MNRKIEGINIQKREKPEKRVKRKSDDEEAE